MKGDFLVFQTSLVTIHFSINPVKNNILMQTRHYKPKTQTLLSFRIKYQIQFRGQSYCLNRLFQNIKVPTLTYIGIIKTIKYAVIICNRLLR